MTHDPRESAALEQQMLEHYRRHSEQVPPPELDARILAAAQAHAANQQRPAAKASALSRLHGWWFGGSQRARWSMAFASIATLGIGVGLATRTMEQAPEQQYDAAPMALSVPAPAMAPMAEKKASEEVARPRAEMRKQAPAVVSGQLNEQMGKLEATPPAAAAPFADAVAPAAPPVLARKAQADASHDQAQLQRSLQQILQLQRSGHTALAEQQLHTLQQLYPQQDLREQLQRLQHERGQQ
ncbi:hypothetical protein [Pseudomonas turukhanskensis]|uniref:Uncharacterized protein n=1 Tax=Pseudomonas turukhanskensis TaxID=1806536 RepID=A0A9W6NI08_9PSED|nr:hypothetical protein [Pseudomonas turukhanskensis]GLK91648.1 hypothetical protein GCM10017655_47120 [Pseudomonas turukhanskensis]